MTSRAVVPILMIAVTPTLAGCRLAALTHRADPTEQRSAKRETSGKRDPRGGRTDAVREAREQAVLMPAEPYWPYRLAQAHLAADSVEAAEADLKSALQRDPDFAPALSLLSKLYFQQRRHQEAIDRLEAARSRNPALPGALLAGLALHYDALGRSDLAAAALAAVARGDRNEAAGSGVYLTLRGASPDSANGLAANALRDDPKSAASQNNFGITRLRAADPAAAKKAFLAAIEIDPKRPGPYYNLAILEKYYLLDDAAAERWFKLYWERSHDDPDGLASVFGKGETKPLAGPGPSE